MNVILKNFKPEKNVPKTSKNQHLKKLNNHVRRPQMKNFQKIYHS